MNNNIITNDKNSNKKRKKEYRIEFKCVSIKGNYIADKITTIRLLLLLNECLITITIII